VHSHDGIFNRQSDCKNQTDVTTFRVGETIHWFCTQDAENPSYATEFHDLWHQKTRAPELSYYLRNPTFSHSGTIPECDTHTDTRRRHIPH